MSPFDDPDITTIAKLKIAKEIERISGEIANQRREKKADLSRRGLARSGGMIASMHQLNLKSLERRVHAIYASWKEALTETGQVLTPDVLRRIAAEAVGCLQNAPSALVQSVRTECAGMDDVIDRGLHAQNDADSIRARFLRDVEIEVTKAKVSQRASQGDPKRSALRQSADAQSELDSEPAAKQMVLEVVNRYMQKGTGPQTHRLKAKFPSKWRLLDELCRRHILQIWNGTYLPCYAAFAFEDEKIRSYAERCAAIVLKTLRALYAVEGIRDYSFVDVSKAALQLEPHAEPECLKLGALLATSFRTCVQGWQQSESGEVSSIKPNDTILDFTTPAEVWQRERQMAADMDEARERVLGTERPTARANRVPSSNMEFSFMRDSRFRRIVERDYAELQALAPEGATKSMLTLSGSIIEGLLLDALVAGSNVTFEKGTGMNLQDLIKVAAKTGMIREEKLGNALRNYRNLIHPGRGGAGRPGFHERRCPTRPGCR